MPRGFPPREIQLYIARAVCHACRRMRKKFLPCLILPLLFGGGCASNLHFTNLTPSVQTRTTNNLYAVEVEVNSRQQSLRWDSFKPQITAGAEYFKMHATPLIGNRWEGQIAVPPGTSTIHYQYKFDFDYNAFGPAKHDSAVSRQYTLHIVEPNQ
jgi:hypothetical protein